jgi:peroxiredoxin Q/BCP
VDLGAQQGHPLVVFFYPKDGTPGCTKEACAFRDVWKRYEAAKVGVIGVSADDAASHRKFAEEWARAFGVNSTFGMYSRVTFLIDAEGKVSKVYPDVDPGVHAERVLTDAQAR